VGELPFIQSDIYKMRRNIDIIRDLTTKPTPHNLFGRGGVLRWRKKMSKYSGGE
jgi:hypothetical protein